MIKPYVLAIGVLAGAGLAAVGLSRTSEAPAAATAPAPPAELAAPGASQVLDAPAPPAELAAPGASQVLEGKVLETMTVQRYTYLRLDVGGPDGTWAAVPQTSVTAGQKVRVTDVSLMQSFTSKSLDRTFDRIYFGTLAGQGRGAMGNARGKAGGHEGALPSGHPPVPAGPGSSAAPVAAGEVAPAGGPTGRTIAQIHAQAKELDGKQVRVRGVVTKQVKAVLGHNWLHLRDGSTSDGPAADLVVTTKAEAALGQTVLAVGRVTADKDLGSGYRYDVLLEEAEVTATP